MRKKKQISVRKREVKEKKEEEKKEEQDGESTGRDKHLKSDTGL